MVLTGLLMLTSVLVVALILMHKGKGGGLSDMFGGGFTSSYGGSSVAERNLDRITIGLCVIWFATIVALGLMNVS
jgi:preprotein translocase subunit SecG